jgi:hypothetical protein
LLAVATHDTLKVWDVASGELVHTLDSEGGDSSRLAAWSPGGRWLAGGNWHNLEIWSMERGRYIRRIGSGSGLFQSVSWSPDGRRLASGSNRSLTVWNIESGAVAFEIKGKNVTSVAWSPNERWLASGVESGSIAIWDATNGSSIRTLSGAENGAIAWNPDGTLLAVAGTGLRLWDAASGDLLRTLSGHGSAQQDAEAKDGAQRLALLASKRAPVRPVAAAPVEGAQSPRPAGSPIDANAIVADMERMIAAARTTPQWAILRGTVEE